MLLRRATVTCVVIVVAFPFGAPAAYADCAQNERIGGECSAVTTQTSEREVTISLSQTTPGSSGESSSTASRSASQAVAEPPPIRMEAELGSEECEVKIAGLCRGRAPEKATVTTSETSLPPEAPTHVSELGTFRPDQPGIIMEPDGWSLPTLDLNLVSTVTRHRVSGELLGWPVEIRFTPARFRWSFGDGHTATSSQAGVTNASAGRDQFEPSPTSHRYLRPGTYTVNLTVEYDAEFRFEGGTFSDLEGRVTRGASSRTVRVFRVAPLLLGQ